jgi:ribonucleoside-diphosphate reductase beta chain
MRTVLNKNNANYIRQPLFLGEDLSLQRYDRFKYPVFFDLFKKQLEFFWRPEEIELKKDRSDFKDNNVMSDNERFIFTSNIKYQTMMDSVICRGVPILLDYVSNPELEACMKTWEFFEQIHSYSYTYIIKNVYANPSEVLDSCLTDKEIIKRADSAIREYDILNKISKGNSHKNTYKQIYLTLISINILEAVRFYVSFICAFAFAENKKMVGNADIVKLIKRDEALHLCNTQEIIKILQTVPGEGFTQTASECEEEACRMFENAAKEEKEWASYLFKDGSIIGLNETVLHKYIDWLCHTRRKAIGLPYEQGFKNPISGWTEHWMNSESVQVAPQESEITSYKISASTNDLDDIDFGDLGQL